MNDASRKSDFVTVLGWTSAIMGAYGLAFALAIAVPHVVLTLFGAGGPPGEAAMLIVGPILMGILSGVLLFCASAFIRRREWARIVFAVFGIIAAIFTLLGALVTLIAAFGIAAKEAQDSFGAAAEPNLTVFFLLFSLLLLLQIALLVWFVAKLFSRSVREEFADYEEAPELYGWAEGAAGAPRSDFVTVLGWNGVFFSGLGVATALTVLFTFSSFLTEPLAAGFLAEMEGEGVASALAAFWIQNIFILIVLYLLFEIACLVVSIALLKRKNWARILFVVFLGIGIVLLVAEGLFSQLFYNLPMLAEEGAPDGMGAIFDSMRYTSAIMSLGYLLFLGWLIKKLLSAKIREEFGAA